MDYVFDRTDNLQILDHAEYYFDEYPDSYDELIEFYEEWIDSNEMPDITKYIGE